MAGLAGVEEMLAGQGDGDALMCFGASFHAVFLDFVLALLRTDD